MDIPFAGEIAAIFTSIAFSIGPAFFTLAGRQVGSVVVNRTRLVVAVLLLTATHLILFGQLIPFDAGSDRWIWFTLSGVIGLTLGDAALFQAFVMLGTRLTMLVFSLSPMFSAMLAWWLLAENLTPLQIAGMLVTLAGVAWVVAEQDNEAQKSLSSKDYGKGLIFAVLGALGQSIGLITAKFGLAGDFPAISGLVIRMLTAMIAIWIWTAFAREIRTTFQSLRANTTAVKHILAASFIGPFIGVWLSLVAIQFAKIGIASTLMALPPLFLIPIGYFFFKERITPRAIIGTVIALAGVAILFTV
jgi:drug/metabolite transporter (DMT)-like permease